MMTRHLREHPVPWAALVLGTGWAVLGNVAHAGNNPIRVAYGVGVPVALLLALEMIVRRSPRGGWIAGLAWLAGLGVAALTASVSYVHQHALLLHLGEDSVTATLLPLAPDALMAVATAVLLGKRELAAPDPIVSWRMHIPLTRPAEAVSPARIAPVQRVTVPIAPTPDTRLTGTPRDTARAMLAAGRSRQAVAQATGLKSDIVARLDRARLKKAGA